MESFTDLAAWQKAKELAQEVYFLTKEFPPDERFGMTAQIRKSSVSVLANIAEGFGRFTYPDKANRYVIARGELAETKSFLLVAAAVGCTTEIKIQKH